MNRLYFLSTVLFISLISNAQKVNVAMKNFVQINEIECSFQEKFGEIVIEKEDTISKAFYDRQGRIVYEVLSKQTANYNNENQGELYAKFYRYNNDKLESIYTFSSKCVLTQLVKYTYNKYGVSVIDYYDGQNNLVNKVKYTHSDNGRKIVCKEYYKDGTERETRYYEVNALGDTVYCRTNFGGTHFTFDKSHRLTSNYVKKDFQDRYKYDNHGNCILEYPYRYSTWDKKWIIAYPQKKYVYKYDERGNWVEKTSFDILTDVVTRVTSVTKRTIAYSRSNEDHDKYLEYLESLFQKAYNTIKNKE